MASKKKGTKKNQNESGTPLVAYPRFKLYQVDLEGKFKVKLYSGSEEDAKLEVWNIICQAFQNRIIAQNPEDGGLDIIGVTGIDEGHEDYIRSVWY